MFLHRLNVVHPVNDEGFGGSRIHLSENNGKILMAAKADRASDFGEEIPHHPGGFPDSFPGGGNAFLPQEGPAFFQMGRKIFIYALMDHSDLFDPAHFLPSPPDLPLAVGRKEKDPTLQPVDRPSVPAKFALSRYHDSQSPINGKKGYCFSFARGNAGEALRCSSSNNGRFIKKGPPGFLRIFGEFPGSRHHILFESVFARVGDGGTKGAIKEGE
jgi:hypothetical protein